MPRHTDKTTYRPKHEDLKEVVHRTTQRNFCAAAVDNILGGKDLDTALIGAVKDTYIAPNGAPYVNDDAALRKGQVLIERPHVMAGMQILFEEAGLSAAQAATTHVEHIKGIEYTGPDGELVKAAPNYAALKDYWALTVPRPPTKLEVRSMSVAAMVDKPSSPLMASRSLKKVESRE